jgi:hypothetical protein
VLLKQKQPKIGWNQIKYKQRILIQNKSVDGMGKRKKKKPDKVKACLSTGSQVKYPRQVQTNRNKRDPEENHKKKNRSTTRTEKCYLFFKSVWYRRASIKDPVYCDLWPCLLLLSFVFVLKKREITRYTLYNNQRETICRLICCWWYREEFSRSSCQGFPLLSMKIKELRIIHI